MAAAMALREVAGERIAPAVPYLERRQRVRQPARIPAAGPVAVPVLADVDRRKVAAPRVPAETRYSGRGKHQRIFDTSLPSAAPFRLEGRDEGALVAVRRRRQQPGQHQVEM